MSRTPPNAETLPIAALRPELETALRTAPVVVTAPTGTGKSTLVPRWCPGRVLVVEPRRVACRSLAQRVAELEGTGLGEGVGYWVRDERRAGGATRILFATPGVVLRIFERLGEFDTVVLDEFHERSLDVDLLLALLQRRFFGALAVMSATLAAERLASHLDGRHLHAEGRTFPVAMRHLAGKALLPDVQGLEGRVAAALEASRDDPGDVLVFLPGKGEIAACAATLERRRELQVLELHGSLSLAEQARAFEPPPAGKRKVILATNVAETSITLPGVGVVIDSGLVRQTRYHRDRGFLTLVPIAQDSAEQRAGRAGRTAAGVCYRLWSEAAQLESRTPPEVHRESLVPLVLAAAACGERVDELPFVDAPPEHAVATARDELERLGAIDEAGAITERGRAIFGLPLDAPLGRLLVEAEARRHEWPEVLEDVIDLVSLLAVDRPLLPRGGRAAEAAQRNDDSLCDAVTLLHALRRPPQGADRRNPFVLREAHATARRLRRAYGLDEGAVADRPVDRRRLALTVLGADPRSAHVARRRGRRIAWSNGGTEIELGRESAVAEAEGVEALAALATRALGLGGRDTRVLITCAMPVPLAWLLEAGLGRDRLAEPALEEGVAVAVIERVHAKKVLAVRQEVPQGELARQAVARLFLRGSLDSGTLAATTERLEAAALAERLARSQVGVEGWLGELERLYGLPVPELAAWVERRLADIGLENGADLPLLAADDLLAPELPSAITERLDREFPRRLELPSGQYRVTYDLARRTVTLERHAGRGAPPTLAYLPRFTGFAIKVRHGQALHTVREGG